MRRKKYVREEPPEKKTEHSKTKLEKARGNISYINNLECNKK